MTKRTCCMKDCNKPASRLVIETHVLACLFDSGCGLTCEDHAEELSDVGGYDLGDIVEIIQERT